MQQLHLLYGQELNQKKWQIFFFELEGNLKIEDKKKRPVSATKGSDFFYVRRCNNHGEKNAEGC